MPYVPMRLYGLVDYLFGIFLIASPMLLDFAQGGMETVIPLVVGINMLVLALITNAEWGIARMISFETHLVLGLSAGLFLAVSPWAFGFAAQVFVPHLCLGLFIACMVLVVHKGPLHIRTRTQMIQNWRLNQG